MINRLTRNDLKATGKTIYYCGYCRLQNILGRLYDHKIGYACGTYGWNYDVYEFDDAIICTGYRSMPGRQLKGYAEIDAAFEIAYRGVYDYKQLHAGAESAVLNLLQNQ